jgi:peptide-methionine (S)-S-oxide reductase
MIGRRLLQLLGLGALAAVGTPAAAGAQGAPLPAGTMPAATARATFAGGCFWCMEEAFEKVDGVVSVTSGYTGGHTKNPTYEETSAGGTGHAESIEIVYDTTKIGYDRLLDVFWHNVDPVARDRQFCDAGSQYRSAIFYHDDAQRRLAEQSKERLEASGRFKQEGIATEITAAATFYPAEEYHQDYYRKNPVRYKYYKWSCGRAQRLEQIWGKKPEAS